MAVRNLKRVSRLAFLLAVPLAAVVFFIRLWQRTRATTFQQTVPARGEVRAFAREPKAKLIACVLYPGVTTLDVVGTLEALIGLEVGSPYRLVTVGERIAPIETDTPLKMMPAKTFDEVPRPSALIVPGGGPATLQAMRNAAVLQYVRAAAEQAEVVASIGAGSLILAAAGLLEGRQATTHWAYAELLEQLGARYVQKRWIEDGRFITAAGVSAGIDMALYLVARLKSQSAARLIQLVIEYDPQPPFGGIDWRRVERDRVAALLAPQPADVEQALAGRLRPEAA